MYSSKHVEYLQENGPLRKKKGSLQIYRLPYTTEMERFELSRQLPDLPHFECGPFSHLGTSP